MNKTLKVIEYTHAEIFNFACDCFYDIYITDRCEVESIYDGTEPITALRDPDEFIKALKGGFSPVMLPDFHHIENLTAANENFIVVVYINRGGKRVVWATINGNDIFY